MQPDTKGDHNEGKKNMGLPKIERQLPSILLNFGAIWLQLLLIIMFVVAAEKLDHKVLDSECQ